MENAGRMLIVEDEKTALKNLEHVMKKEGYRVTGTMSGPNALQLLEKNEYDIVLTDLKMEKVDGVEVLEKSKSLYPDSEVIMITAYASIPSAVETMKKGAYDYIAKPFNLDDVRKAVRAALERVALRKENTQLREQLEQFEGKVKIVTQNSMMQKLLETARQIAPTDCNVLITGESGTGKELFARYLHFTSNRSKGGFFAINCGALTEDLLANELFGHEKGAFTGANSLKKGIIESASGGTLFLDEITEMSAAMQVKLLRVLQEKELIRVGGTDAVEVDVRILAASNRNLHEATMQKRFRQDLYYRLNVVSLHIPPLSERRDDIPLLCQYFLKKYSALMNKDVREMSPSVIGLLMNYDFPGNVRELENIVERGVALANDRVVEMAHLPDDLKDLDIKTFRRKEGRYPTLAEQELSYIRWVLQETGGNKTLTAGILGIDRVSLWRKIKKYEMEEV
ncbi:MAG: sigma-54 dependent transcriptional regulator [Actinobacteria bacterium]|nr:sigma-54 dependent transcriptional regulator [Actinomycetota bacterium]MCL5882832.1 sigma-54 dependent transcriptional regulator [Actinomycetota bacterium]